VILTELPLLVSI